MAVCGSTFIEVCDGVGCSNDYQEKEYGPKRRVHNVVKKGMVDGVVMGRCTSCLKINQQRKVAKVEERAKKK